MKKGLIVVLLGLAGVFLGGCFQDGKNGTNGINGVNGTNADTAMTWTLRTDGVAGYFNYNPRLVWGNNQFVVVSQGSTLTSADGKSWVTHPSSFSSVELTGLAWGADKFIATGGGLNSSPDGVTWTSVAISVPANFVDFTAIARGADKFVAIGSSAGDVYTNYAFTSADGVTWAQHTIGTSNNYISSIFWVNNKYIATGSSPIVFTSSDGMQWTRDSGASSVGELTSMAFGAQRYVGAGGGGGLHGSTDGINWTRGIGPGDASTFGSFLVVWDGNRFVAMDPYTILLSTDGINWTTQPGVGIIYQMAMANNTIVAIGQWGIFTSPVSQP